MPLMQQPPPPAPAKNRGGRPRRDPSDSIVYLRIPEELRELVESFQESTRLTEFAEAARQLLYAGARAHDVKPRKKRGHA